MFLRRRFIKFMLSKASLLAVGCGTIMYPERRGQMGGRLDWRVVTLDAVGLLLFFIPGVIAFAVDFSNGTIYLPPEGQALRTPAADARKFVEVKLPDEPITTHKLVEILSQHTGREIQLAPGAYQTEELETMDDFWATTEKYRDTQKSG